MIAVAMTMNEQMNEWMKTLQNQFKLMEISKEDRERI